MKKITRKKNSINRLANSLITRRGGFTLIEMLVAMAAFGLIIVAVSGVFSAIVKAQREIIGVQNAQEPARYLLESMTKEIRMSTVNSDTTTNPLGDASLIITTPKGESVIYAFSGTSLTRAGNVISPANVDVSGKFFIVGTASSGQSQVTVVMKIKSKNLPAQYQTEINFQTTVSARGY